MLTELEKMTLEMLIWKQLALEEHEDDTQEIERLSDLLQKANALILKQSLDIRESQTLATNLIKGLENVRTILGTEDAVAIYVDEILGCIDY